MEIKRRQYGLSLVLKMSPHHVHRSQNIAAVKKVGQTRTFPYYLLYKKII